MNGALGREDGEGPLSHRALNVVASVPGVTSVLVGMRRPEYVDDVVAASRRAPIADPAPALDALRGVAIP